MDSAIPCTICHESDHRLQKCPELYSVEKYSGGGEGGEHSHDDDEKVSNEAPQPICPIPE